MKTNFIAQPQFRHGLAIILIIATSIITALPSQATDLTYVLGSQGLTSLTYKGFQMMPQTYNGRIQIRSNSLSRPDGSTYTGPVNSGGDANSYGRNGSTVTATYSWCIITATYSQIGDRLNVDLNVQNTTTQDKISGMQIRFGRLTYPQDGYVSWVGQTPFLFSSGLVSTSASKTPWRKNTTSQLPTKRARNEEGV